ncbi:DUF3054 domain-containing protein [Amnibacterium endophyticum]|uniref:DUF3054 domain-containing protein n=1 Tax=Amnibacterium endophyticum TaxID=2109337 RepID=A0ABW4LFX9_9MICO
MDDRVRTVTAAVVDALLVALFVLIGRASHREDQSAFLVTYWPFLAGLAVGWLAARAWRAPFAVVRTGLPVWAATVAVGMVLRVASDQGVQVSFVVVAAIVLAAFLLGWRAVLVAVTRASRRERDRTGAAAGRRGR